MNSSLVVVYRSHSIPYADYQLLLTQYTR